MTKKVSGETAKVAISESEECDMAIGKEQCMVKHGAVYWGLSSNTKGLHKIMALWNLTDGTTIYEARNPTHERDEWEIHKLSEEGLYMLGEVVLFTRGDRAASVYNVQSWTGNPLRILPLPLRVGMKSTYEASYLTASTNPEVTGWACIEGKRQVKSEVLGQYCVEIDRERFECLLLREILESSGVVTRGDGRVKEVKLSYRILQDRYLNRSGRLRLLDTWYCDEGGRNSMTREEARKKGGAIFDEIGYRNRFWYKVIRVPLHEPRPAEAKKWLEDHVAKPDIR